MIARLRRFFADLRAMRERRQFAAGRAFAIEQLSEADRVCVRDELERYADTSLAFGDFNAFDRRMLSALHEWRDTVPPKESL